MSKPITLTKTQLTAVILLISLVPPIFVVSMVLNHEPPPEPVLKVDVSQEVRLHYPRAAADSPKLLPCVIVKNATEATLRNVSICLNEQFFYYHAGEFESASDIVVPLEFFVTKGGNVAFQPGSETVSQVTVYAQIPSGARAVSETHFDGTKP